MTNRILGSLVGLLPALLFTPAIQADTTLTLKDAQGGVDSFIEVKGPLVRVSQAGQPDYMVFDMRRDMAIHVNTRDRQYTEIDRATLEGLANSMDALQKPMAMMREQLKSLPPEQRAMIEQQMGGMVNLGAMESAPVEKITTVKRGSDKVAGFACQRYDVMNGNERIADACLATAADAGMSKADFATLNATMKFMRDMAQSAEKLTAGMGGPQLAIGDVEGVPVAMKDFKYGHEYQVSDVSDKTLDTARFSEYEGFSKQALPKLP